ncbi:MAG: Anti-sigma factor antagonist [Actinomycetia bacterium]|nr:Anti-sigma factor antagonist [Actinomycetes bacterium]
MSVPTAAAPSFSAPDFSATIEIGPRTGVVRLSGELDLATVPLLQESLLELYQAFECVVVDMAALTFMDCYALGVLAETNRCAARSGIGFVFQSVHGIPLRVMQCTGLDQVFDIREAHEALPSRRPSLVVPVSLSKLRRTDTVVYAEVEVDDLYADDWLAHPCAGYAEQVIALAPGTVDVKILDGPLAGATSRATVLKSAAGPVLMGEAGFETRLH